MPRTLSEQEWNAIRDEVLSSLPPGLTEEEFNRTVPSLMAQKVGEAESKPAPLQGSALRRSLGGAAAMLNPVTMAQGAYGAVRHPVETGKAIVGQMGDQWQQAGTAASEGRYIEAGGHALAGSVPLIGPASAAVGEQIGSGDWAGGAGATAGMLIPIGAPSAVRGARRLVPAGAREAIATGLEGKAAARVEDVMSPKVGANKTRFGGMAEDVAPALAKSDVTDAWSRSGMHGNVEAAFTRATAALDEAANARNAGNAFPTKPILDALREKRRRWTAEAVEGSRPLPSQTANAPQGQFYASVEGRTARPIGQDVVPAPNAARVAQIDQAISEIEQLGPVARYESLRRIREAYDGPAKAKYSPSMTQDFIKAQGGASGAADVTDALRTHLATLDPQTATANAQYSLMKTARDVMDATAEVERTRPKVGRQIMARLTGTLGGGQVAGTAGAVTGFVFAPIIEAAMSAGVTTQLQTAKFLTQLASAIRSGNQTAALGLMAKIKRMLPQAGVLTERSRSGMVPAVAEDPASTPPVEAGRQ